jgi:hypothetical protein
VRKLLAHARNVTSPQGWLIVGTTFVVTFSYIFRRLFHWGPDTRYYLALTYRLMGHSEHESGRLTYEFMLSRFEWFKTYCYFACEPNSPEATFGHLFHGEAGGMVATRMVYPLLSVPFVWLFGPQGMLVVPLLAFAACVVMVMAFVSRTVGRNWAVVAALALIVPTTISSYGLYTYTESLAMMFVAGCLLVLPIARAGTRRDVAVFGILLFLLAFTRQFHPIIVAGVGLAWLGGAVAHRKLRNEWLPYFAMSIGVMAVAGVVQSLAGPYYSIFKMFAERTGVRSASDVPGIAADIALRLAKQELFEIGVDIPLVFVCTFAAIGVFWRFRSPVALLTLGSVTGTFLLNVLNTEPSHFRYYVTAFPFVAMVATGVIADLVQRTKSPLFLPPPAPANIQVVDKQVAFPS